MIKFGQIRDPETLGFAAIPGEKVQCFRVSYDDGDGIEVLSCVGNQDVSGERMSRWKAMVWYGIRGSR